MRQFVELHHLRPLGEGAVGTSELGKSMARAKYFKLVGIRTAPTDN